MTGPSTAKDSPYFESKHTNLTPSDTTGWELDSNGLPADAEKWSEEIGNFVAPNGDEWQYQGVNKGWVNGATGWYLNGKWTNLYDHLH